MRIKLTPEEVINKKWRERKEFDEKYKKFCKLHRRVIFDTEGTSDCSLTWGVL